MAAAAAYAAQGKNKVTKYIRYRYGSTTAYGILDGDSVRELRGDLFGDRKETGTKHRLVEVKLLHPCEPQASGASGNFLQAHHFIAAPRREHRNSAGGEERPLRGRTGAHDRKACAARVTR
jgi:hypothetical protein